MTAKRLKSVSKQVFKGKVNMSASELVLIGKPYGFKGNTTGKSAYVPKPVRSPKFRS